MSTTEVEYIALREGVKEAARFSAKIITTNERSDFGRYLCV